MPCRRPAKPVIGFGHGWLFSCLRPAKHDRLCIAQTCSSTRVQHSVRPCAAFHSASRCDDGRPLPIPSTAPSQAGGRLTAVNSIARALDARCCPCGCTNAATLHFDPAARILRVWRSLGLASPPCMNCHRRQAASTPAKHTSTRTEMPAHPPLRMQPHKRRSSIPLRSRSLRRLAPSRRTCAQPWTSRPRCADTRSTSRTRIAAPFNATSSTCLPRPRHKIRIPARFRVRGSSDTATAAGPRAGACRAALMQPRPSASSAHVPSRARSPALPGTSALRP